MIRSAAAKAMTRFGAMREPILSSIQKGDGKDVIYGFDNNDMLKITGAFSASYKKSNDAIYFKVGSTKNAITLKNFDAITFNINGKDYTISGKKLVRK